MIFAYTNRHTDLVVKYFARVDVTEEFPFLVTKLSPSTIDSLDCLAIAGSSATGFTDDDVWDLRQLWRAEP